MMDKLHGGDIYESKILCDFSVNVNPLGLPKGVCRVLKASVKHWNRYPDPKCRELTGRLAEYHGVKKERIVCGNGAADLIYRLASCKRPKRALLPAPTFSEYERALRAVGCRIRYWPLNEEEDYRVDVCELADFLQEGEMLFLCNPNNPTGLAVPAEQVELLAEACQKKQGFLVLDECFCDFLEQQDLYSFVERLKDYPKTAILRAFTKSYAMAGLRLGYLICGQQSLAEHIQRTGQPWSVSIPAQEAGVAALEEREYLEQTRRLVVKEREWMREGLLGLGFRVFPSQANYLLFKDTEETRYGNLWESLKRQGILIRDCSNFRGLETVLHPPGAHYYRTGIRTREENEYLIKALRQRI